MHRILLAVLLLTPAFAQDVDPRESYDVQAYHLNLRVDPEQTSLSGDVTLEGKVVRGPLDEVHLDLTDNHKVDRVVSLEKDLEFTHSDNRIVAKLGSALAKGSHFSVTVHYAREEAQLQGGRRRRRSSVLWAETPSGAPWVGTSCQGPGAHSWWPCKSNYFNPEDKPERVALELTVPAELYAVANGRLQSIAETEDGWKTYAWNHPYPLETYTVTMNIAPYVVVEDELELPGLEEPVPYVYYVLPENAEKAAVQFTQVPEMLRIYSEAFGPWPFPDSKFGLVETSFWGMEHSTAVAYGSSYPLWCQQNDEKDPYEGRNRFFDYILIHEVAHEWWGNAVSTNDWGHFWIHEGFGTYAEGVYVEMTQGRERADEYFAGQARRSTGAGGRIWRGEDPVSGKAYSGLIYSKGACVLNTLRHYVDDDEAWWASLRAFNLKHRYGNADTEDFRAILEEQTGKPWKRFFDEWFYGDGAPTVSGEIKVRGETITYKFTNEGNGDTTFLVPVDITWKQDGESKHKRFWIEPGGSAGVLNCGSTPSELELGNQQRVLGTFEISLSE